MTYKEFANTLFDKGSDNILPKGTAAQKAVDILAEHFLGEYIIDGYPCTTDQWNSEVVFEILRLFPQGKIRRIPKRK